MELKQFLRLLWRRSWLIILMIGVAGTAAYLVSKQSVPVYEASTTLLINPARANIGALDFNALRASESVAKTYVELLSKRPVLEGVIANLQLSVKPEQLAKRMRVEIIQNTQLIDLIVEDTDPQRAADIANEIVRVFTQQNKDLQTSRYAASKQSLQQELAKVQADVDSTQAKLDALGPLSSPEKKAEQSQLQSLLAQHRSSYSTLFKSLEDVRLAEAQTTDNLNVVESAYPEQSPISPKTRLNTLVAMIIAAMIGIALVYVLGYLDDSVKSGEELERVMSAPTIATITRIDGSSLPDRLIVATNGRSPTAEAYRMLRTNIAFAAVDSRVRTIVVTSSSPSEGKSVTAANLAVAFAQTGQRVVLVDADLRRPTMHQYFEQMNYRGVTTALLRHDGDVVDNHLLPSGVDNLRLMPSGPLPPSPAELLGSQRMAALIEELKEQADIVIFDTPPLLAVIDAALLAHVCDATLLVVAAGSTRAGALKISRDQLAQSGARLLGTVLNRVSSTHSGYYQPYYYNGDKSTKRHTRWLRGPFRRARHGKAGAASGPALPASEPSGKRHIWSLPAPFRRVQNGMVADASGSFALRAMAEAPREIEFYLSRNGKPADGLGSLAQRAVVEAVLDQELRRGRNGDALDTADSVTPNAVVDDASDRQAIEEDHSDSSGALKNGSAYPIAETNLIQQQIASARPDAQRSIAARKSTTITVAGAPNAGSRKRVTRSGRRTSRIARKHPKITP